LYHERMGMDEQFDEKDEEGQPTTRTITTVAHERQMDELRARISELEAAPVVERMVSVETERVKTEHN